MLAGLSLWMGAGAIGPAMWVGNGAAAADTPTATAAPAADVAERLGAVADQGTARITTIGRRSGNPHTVTIWFLVEGSTVYLTTLDADRDWVRNALANPDVELDFDPLRVRGRFAVIEDAALDAHVRELLVAKYAIARVGSWFGKGPEKAFRIDDLVIVAPPE